MEGRVQRIFPLFVSLAAWCLLLLTATSFQKWWWSYRHGINWFDISWIGVSTFVAAAVTLFFIWRKAGRVTLAQWAWFAVPYCVSFYLLWKTGQTLRAFALGPTRQLLVSYSLFSCGFAADIAFWIAGFPYEDLLGPESKVHRVPWKVALYVFAVATGVLALTQSLVIAQDSSTPSLAQLNLLQSWIQTITVVVFIFLITRVFLLLTVRAAARRVVDPPLLTSSNRLRT